MAGPISRLLLGLSAVALPLAAGCGNRLVYNDTVEGTVTLDGRPLPGVRLEFVPEAQSGRNTPTSTALTDAAGRYRLTCSNNKPGAVVGKYRVVVLQGRAEEAVDPDSVPTRAPPAPLPMVYGIAAKTPLRVEVTADQHAYDLQLSRFAQAAP